MVPGDLPTQLLGLLTGEHTVEFSPRATSPMPFNYREAESQAIQEASSKHPSRARAICGEDDIRLPRSSGRSSATTSLKLLSRVNPERPGAFAFEGTFLRPGGTIAKAQLPSPALLLECCGSTGNGWGHNRSETLHILWRWDGADWKDIAQMRSVGSEWVEVFHPIITRELATPKNEQVLDLIGIVQRVLGSLESELEGGTNEDRLEVFEVIYERLPAMMTARKPMGQLRPVSTFAAGKSA